ncbi:hypothetical protein BU15DRAFT_54176 [Melanogaster broomeanus]|nr:hypothetical protein BU15DRAFT_54176 [Melanogaster broomeanus]
MKYPTDRNRFIFRQWTRDPNGKPVAPSEIRGKEAGNGLDLWGATLYDFYHFRRIPDNIYGITISTGSKLTKVMKALGELEAAKDEIAWAEQEEDPREIPAWDPAEAIVGYERRVHWGICDAASMRKDVAESARKRGAKEEPNSDADKQMDRSLPIHLLPKKLHVHDPWNLVCVEAPEDDDTDHESKAEAIVESWTTKKDLVRTYNLSLSSESQRAAEQSSKVAIALEDEALKIPQIIMIYPQETEGPTEEPAIRAVLPQRRRKLTEVPEGHLYLSPSGKLGTGHHSIVYNAEWELPRDLFCESVICNTCVSERVREEVERLKKSGEWEQRLQEAVNTYESVKKRDVSREAASSDAMEVDSEASPPKKVINRIREYEGPIVSIHPDVKWQNPSYPETICKHRHFFGKPVPRTARFRVAAKLSFPGDGHLAREARNYLNFPAHFFQHWNGYNVVAPLHDPTPVGALVPQFFGYYVPHSKSKHQYRSPILLIEDCGEPVDPDTLSTDDKHECVALLFRFHHAGWLHESFAARNILIQTGHPTLCPLERMVNPTHSVRLIDFGRSRKYETPGERCVEESLGKRLFGMI